MTTSLSFTNAPLNPAFSTIRTGEPTTGDAAGWFWSPNEDGSDAARNRVAQQHHRTPSQIISDEKFGSYFGRISSDTAGEGIANLFVRCELVTAHA